MQIIFDNIWYLLLMVFIIMMGSMFGIYGGFYLSYKAEVTEGYYFNIPSSDNLDPSVWEKSSQYLLEYFSALGFNIEGYELEGYELKGRIIFHKQDLAVEYTGTGFATEAMTQHLSSHFNKYLIFSTMDRFEYLKLEVNEIDENELSAMDQEERDQFGKFRSEINDLGQTTWYGYRKWGVISNKKTYFWSIFRPYIPNMNGEVLVSTFVFGILILLPMTLLSLGGYRHQHWYSILLIPLVIVLYHFLQFGPKYKALRIDFRYQLDDYLENIYWQIQTRKLINSLHYLQRADQIGDIKIYWPSFHSPQEVPMFYNHEYFHFSIRLAIPRSQYNQFFNNFLKELKSINIPSSEIEYFQTIKPEGKKSDLVQFYAESSTSYTQDLKSGRIKVFENFWIIFIIVTVMISLNFAFIYIDGNSLPLELYDTTEWQAGDNQYSLEIPEFDRYTIHYEVTNESSQFFQFDVWYFIGDKEIHHHDGGNYGNDRITVTIEDSWLIDEGDILRIRSNTSLHVKLSIYKGSELNTTGFNIILTPIAHYFLFLLPLFWLLKKPRHCEFDYIPSIYKEYIQDIEHSEPEKKFISLYYALILLTSFILGVTGLYYLGVLMKWQPILIFRLFEFRGYGLITMLLIYGLNHLPFRYLTLNYDFTGKHRMVLSVIGWILLSISYSLMIPGFIIFLQLKLGGI